MNQKMKVIAWMVLIVFATILIMYVASLNKRHITIEQEKKAVTIDELMSRVDILEYEVNEMRLLKISEDEKAKTRYNPTTINFFFLAILMVIIFVFYSKTMYQLQLLKKEVIELKKALIDESSDSPEDKGRLPN